MSASCKKKALKAFLQWDGLISWRAEERGNDEDAPQPAYGEGPDDGEGRDE